MNGGPRRGARNALRKAGHRVLPVSEFAIAQQEAAAENVEWVSLEDLEIPVADHGTCDGAVAYLDGDHVPVAWCSTPFVHRDAWVAYRNRLARGRMTAHRGSGVVVT